jgi:hypothetical protein
VSTSVTLAPDGQDATGPVASVGDVVGRRVGRYVIRRKLGSGGGGTVFEAEDPELGRSVAIKLIPIDQSRGRGAQRLLREAKVLAQLTHPNVVTVLDVGQGCEVLIPSKRTDAAVTCLMEQDPEFSKLAPPARGLARVSLAELLSAQGDRAEAEALKRALRSDLEQAPPHSAKTAKLRHRLGG